MIDQVIFGGVTVFLVTLVAAMSPGPDMLIVLRNALVQGRRGGVLTALGVGAGIFVHVGYTLFGISLLISESVMLFNMIKYAGAAYLIYMGIMALRSKGWEIKRSEEERAEDAAMNRKDGLKAFWAGFITNVLNPKAVLFFLAVFTQVISPDTPAIIQFSYGCICAATAAAWFSIFSVFLTHRSVRDRLAKASIWIDRATGVGFIALAIKLAFAKLATKSA